jgi:hypothetical protein
MEYRLNKEDLLKTLSGWNGFLKRKVHLIACGGTALTLLGVKASTKDVDFIVPEPSEHKYLVGVLDQLGYKQVTGAGWKRDGEMYIFDLFKGKRVHTTELLESPLRPEGNSLIKEFSSLYIGVLNPYDLIVSKLFRCSSVDVEDCLMLVRSRREEINIQLLGEHFKEMASYDIAEERMMSNWEHFKRMLKKEGLYGE